MKTINFFKNHNSKLKCEYFTTIRPLWDYYKQGEEYAIVLNKVHQFTGVIIEIRSFKLESVNNFVAMLDAAQTPHQFKETMRRMYPKKDLDKEPLLLLLIKNINF